MLRTIFWYTAGWSYLVLTYPLLLIIGFFDLIKKDEIRDRMAADLSSKIARTLFRFTGSRISVTGVENIPEEGAVLFVSNHQGHVDSLIMNAFIDKRKGFISIVEAQRIPILRTWMKRIKCVFLDRNDARQSLACINEAVEYMKDGQSMVVFPEGKLNDGKMTGDFKRGWLKIAIKSGAPIIPVSISNSYKILSKDGKRVDSASMECVIAAPVPTDNVKKDGEVEFIEMVRSIIVNNIRQDNIV
ncbi:MAG: lysophospholipid acyltransferase family protein [Saccharofermentanales bacterium]